MRTVAIVVVALLAGCAPPAEDRAEAVCARQGHPRGSPGYDACWNSVYPALIAASSRIRAAAIAAP